MDPEFDVENMDIRWLVKTAKKEIDILDLNNYVEGILYELDNIVDILPKVDMFNKKEKVSKNLYQLTQSLVHNSQIYLLAGKLPELKSALEPLSGHLDDNDKDGFDIYLKFIDGIINYDKLLKDNNHDDEWKESPYRRESLLLKEISVYFSVADRTTSIMAQNYQGLIKKNMGDEDAALAQFNKCISELEDIFCHKDIYNKIKNKNTLTEEEYHALELVGYVEFNAARLEEDGEEKIKRLDNAISWRNHALDFCPSYLNDTTARYELMYAYATLAGYMIENCPEKDMKHLLETLHKLHFSKDVIYNISPYVLEKMQFISSVSESYTKVIEPMFEKVRSKIEELGEQHEKGHVNLKDVCDSASDLGLKPETIRFILKQLQRQASICRPKPDHIKLIDTDSHKNQQKNAEGRKNN